MLQFIKPSGSIVAPGHLFIHLYLFSWVMIATTMIPLLFCTFLHFYFLVLKSTTVLLLGTSSSVPARPLFFHMPFHPRERTIIAIYHVSHSCLFCTRFAGFLFVSGKQAFAKPVGFRSACTTCISSTVSEPTQLTALLKNKTKNPPKGKPCKKKKILFQMEQYACYTETKAFDCSLFRQPLGGIDCFPLMSIDRVWETLHQDPPDGCLLELTPSACQQQSELPSTGYWGFPAI